MTLPDMNVRQVLASLFDVPTSFINTDVVRMVSDFGQFMFIDDEAMEMANSSLQQLYENKSSGTDTRRQG